MGKASKNISYADFHSFLNLGGLRELFNVVFGLCYKIWQLILEHKEVFQDVWWVNGGLYSKLLKIYKLN